MFIDLDNAKFWVLVGHKIVTGLGTPLAVIMLWLDRIEKAEEKIKWVEHHIERRHGMSIIDEVKLLIGVIPKVEKVISDAKAAEQTPQVTQLIADLEAVISEVKSVMPAASAPPAPGEPTAAPPAPGIQTTV